MKERDKQIFYDFYILKFLAVVLNCINSKKAYLETCQTSKMEIISQKAPSQIIDKNLNIPLKRVYFKKFKNVELITFKDFKPQCNMGSKNMLKVNGKDTETIGPIFSKLTIKIEYGTNGNLPPLMILKAQFIQRPIYRYFSMNLK